MVLGLAPAVVGLHTLYRAQRCSGRFEELGVVMRSAGSAAALVNITTGTAGSDGHAVNFNLIP